MSGPFRGAQGECMKRLQALLPFLLLAQAGCDGAQASAEAPTTLIVARHAERDPGDDPPLNTEGQARAQKLASVLEQAGVTAIYTTQYLRNRQTAQPLSERVGVPVTLRDIDFDENDRFATNLLEDIRLNHRGGVVVVIGHSNGMNREIYQQLGGAGTGANPGPNRYEELYVGTWPADGTPRWIRTTYGGKSTLDP